MSAAILAAECEGSGYCAPGTDAFIFEPLFEFELFGVHFEFTKITLLVLLSVVLISWFFLWAFRRPSLVPSKGQFLGESIYDFVRNGVAREVIGPDGVKFAPYLTTLFCFILVNNLYGIIPLAQVSPMSHIAYPAVLAAISFVVFNWVGIKAHGAGPYFKDMAFPPGVPKPMYLLLTPIELFSTLIVRPFTLAVRLFANMFAGHLLLLVFITSTSYLLAVGNYSVIFAPFAFATAIILTFFELVVEILQAYVFVVLNAVYISGALAEEH